MNQSPWIERLEQKPNLVSLMVKSGLELFGPTPGQGPRLPGPLG